MLTSKILTSRREREAALEAEVEAQTEAQGPSSPVRPHRPRLWIRESHGSPAPAVQGPSLLTSTALGERRRRRGHACSASPNPPYACWLPSDCWRTMNAAVHGTGITPLVASPLPPAASMGRETSQTDPQLLEELLPFLDTSSEGHMGTTGQQRLEHA